MRRRRWGLRRDHWWLLLILSVAIGPLIASLFLAVGVVVLASTVVYIPPATDPFPPPGPPPPAAGAVQFRVTVQGDGQVYISPAGGSCSPGQTCVYDYSRGEQLTLAAVAGFSPGSNATFAGWDGDCQHLGREPYPRLAVDSPMDCLARFTPP